MQSPEYNELVEQARKNNKLQWLNNETTVNEVERLRLMRETLLNEAENLSTISNADINQIRILLVQSKTIKTTIKELLKV